MKLVLRLRDPSPDWLALRKVIEGSTTLRPDVTLEVDEEVCRFVDAGGREILAGEECEPLRAVADMDGKMRLLTLLHDRFSS